ncbi:MAG: hypothetical protein ACYCYE_00335 [Clostridia bacterium]
MIIDENSKPGGQLLQAGAEVTAIVEASPVLGGYGVHTAKVCRAGVPFYTSHTISKAIGKNAVEAVEIVQLDKSWKPIPGTEKLLEADTICLATGLTPLVELAWIAGSKYGYGRRAACRHQCGGSLGIL